MKRKKKWLRSHNYHMDVAWQTMKFRSLIWNKKSKKQNWSSFDFAFDAPQCYSLGVEEHWEPKWRGNGLAVRKLLPRQSNSLKKMRRRMLRRIRHGAAHTVLAKTKDRNDGRRRVEKERKIKSILVESNDEERNAGTVVEKKRRRTRTQTRVRTPLMTRASILLTVLSKVEGQRRDCWQA